MEMGIECASIWQNVGSLLNLVRGNATAMKFGGTVTATQFANAI